MQKIREKYSEERENDSSEKKLYVLEKEKETHLKREVNNGRRRES